MGVPIGSIPMRAALLPLLCSAHAYTLAPAISRSRVPLARSTMPNYNVRSSWRTFIHMNEREEGVRAGLVTEVPFEVRFSIGNAITVSGFVLLSYTLISYLLSNGQADLLQTLGFVYAIPALVGGLALKYAELPPVPVESTAQADSVREEKGTKTQKKILSDATRFTYGDAHMEEPLKALKLAPRGMGPPILKSIREAVSDTGGYELGLTFFTPNTPYRVWKDCAPRYSRFFGPNVRAVLRKVNIAERLVELSLITVEDGEDDMPLEVLDDGSLAPVQTAAQEEAAAQVTAA